MFKKIVLFALLLLPLGVMAQENQKIAYINSAEIISAMPEYTTMTNDIQKEVTAVESRMKELEEEYAKKTESFMAEAEGLSETIRNSRLQEIQDIEERASVFNQQSQQRLQQLQQSLFAPIVEKVNTAIQQVGLENNYAYVLDVNPASGGGVIVYVHPNSENATDLVKRKLGL